MSNTGGYTYTRRSLHEPETSAEIYTDHIPERGRSRGLGEGQSEDHAQRSLQQTPPGPIRPHCRLSGCPRCKNKFITVRVLKNLNNSRNIFVRLVLSRSFQYEYISIKSLCSGQYFIVPLREFVLIRELYWHQHTSPTKLTHIKTLKHNRNSVTLQKHCP